MSEHVRSGFAHRKNSPVSFDSICRGCFRTVGNRRNEAELSVDEAGHFCEAVGQSSVDRPDSSETAP